MPVKRSAATMDARGRRTVGSMRRRVHGRPVSCASLGGRWRWPGLAWQGRRGSLERCIMPPAPAERRRRVIVTVPAGHGPTANSPGAFSAGPAQYAAGRGPGLAQNRTVLDD